MPGPFDAQNSSGQPRFLDAQPRSSRSFALALMAAAMLFAPAALLRAQSVAFAGQFTTVASGFSNVGLVATDASGNAYVTDFGNGTITEIYANGDSPAVVVSGLANPTGVTVDGSGNLYVGLYYVGEEIKIAPGGAQTVLGSIIYPTSIALDSSRNVFVASQFVGLYEIPAGGGAPVLVETGNYDASILDAAGDIYTSDDGNHDVHFLSAARSTNASYFSGLVVPEGVALDGAGDLFVADTLGGEVYERNGTTGEIHTIGPLGLPRGVGTDPKGNLFVSDEQSQSVFKVQPYSVNFGSVNVCPAGQTTPAPCSQTLTLNYKVLGDVNFGTANVVTQGAPNLDFQLSGNNTCSGPHLADTSCSVTVTFAPLAPGLRQGAVVLTDAASGYVLATTLIYGQGQGPAVAFSNSQLLPLRSGLAVPQGIAVDAAGDVFIGDQYNADLIEFPAHGAPAITVATNVEPISIAVDGAGNVFFADFGGSVNRIPAGGGPPTVVPVQGGAASAVAVDGAGNLFVALNQGVVEVPANGAPQTTIASAIIAPVGVAVDAADDVFVADEAADAVLEIPGNGGQPRNVVTGLRQPAGVAVDAAGDIFVADKGNDRVVEEPAGGGPLITVASGLSVPGDVAVDGVGNVFIADSYNARVVVAPRSRTPSFAFADTNVGSTSSDSPQSVTVQNIGNQPLTASGTGISVGSNFSQVPGPGTPPDCTSSFSLTPGASCDLSISFTPQDIGMIRSTAVLTDNALNASPATQAIGLNGTAYGPPTINFTVPNQVYGTHPFLVRANSNSNGMITYSYVSGPATLVGNTVTITGAGQVVLQASEAASGYFTAGTQEATFTVSPAVLTVLAVPQNGASQIDVGYGNYMPTLSFFYGITGFVNGDTAAVVSGAPALSVAFGSSTPPVGSYPFTIGVGTLTAANYTFVTRNGTIHVVPASIVVKPNSTTTRYGTAPTLSYAVTGLKYGQTASVFSSMPTVSTTATTSSSIGQYPISVNINGITAPNYTLVAGPNATLTVNPVNLQVKALSTSSTYGAALPALNYAISGFVNGDNSSVVSGTPTISTTAVSGSAAGTYPISAGVGGLSATNYIFSSGPNAVLTILPAVLTVAAQPVSVPYGSPIPPLTYKETGFVNGDSSSVVTGSPNLTTTAKQGSQRGTYPIVITAGTLAARNYTFKLTGSTVTIH